MRLEAPGIGGPLPPQAPPHPHRSSPEAVRRAPADGRLSPQQPAQPPADRSRCSSTRRCPAQISACAIPTTLPMAASSLGYQPQSSITFLSERISHQQPAAISQQYSSLRTNQPSATSQPNRLTTPRALPRQRPAHVDSYKP
jgi:hypothetical protein